MAMAISYSVTVSMSDEIIGMLSAIRSERLVSRFASFGRISLKFVARETSSYVNAVSRCDEKNASAF